MPLYTERRASGMYRIRGTHHGVTVDKSARTRSAEQAEAIREAWERQIFDEQVLGRKRTETFAELAADYLGAGRSLGPKAEAIIIELGTKRADEITMADCDRLAIKIHPGAKASTINRNIISPISAIMSWAAEANRAPLRKWPRRRERQTRTDWRRPAGIEAILAAMTSNEARALAALYVGCGLRASEGVFADGRDFAPDLSQVTVRGTAWEDDEEAAARGYEGTKGFYDRTVPIPQRARELLRPVIHLGPGRALLNSRGEPWADRFSLRSSLNTACRKAGVPPLTPHVFRYTFATWHYAVTKDTMMLMRHGGWTDLKLVQRYTHIADPALRQEVIDAGWAIDGQPSRQKPKKSKGNKSVAA